MTQTDRRQLVANGFRDLQDAICARLEALDGTATFHEDAWQHTHGGGGRTRVIQDGAVIEKGGVNFSAVEGPTLPPSIADRQPEAAGHPFFATGISLVIHPRNPHVPTVHMNCRYFEAGPVWWFGGGSDLTPYYPRLEDVVHFHRTLKAACDQTDPAWHAGFKTWCDEYFRITHRKEQRGVGGIFFDDLGPDRGDFDRVNGFVQATGRAFLQAYAPIMERRKDEPWTDDERWFQQYRRGRYVEFNLVYDRGTLFGLQTGGRIESILMSLPPEVRWIYDYRAQPGSREAELTEKWLQPHDWANESV